MKLKQLLKNFSVTVKGSKEVMITGICAHSERVVPGNLFIAKGKGSRYIAEAISSGAVAIVTDVYDPFLDNIVQVIHPDITALEAQLAACYYHDAHKELFLVGITGTNGKTTCSFLIRHLLENRQVPSGLIGTIEWIVGRHAFPATHTTPDVTTNHKLFYEMVHNGCKAAVMEVSSHALEQVRVRGIDFDVAVFTNLTLDHLDYHETMESYAAAKAKLFSSLGATAVAVVNADDPWAKIMTQQSSAQVMTYGIREVADITAHQIVLSAKGAQFCVNYKGLSIPFFWGLIGRFNIYNCLAAIGVGLAQGISLELILNALRSFKQVPGRLERVPSKSGLNIFVDYAHTDDALYQVLQALCEFKKGKLIVVFGCGGDRDQRKRPKMGRVAEQFADVVVVTSDNPRSEHPEAIIEDILRGVQEPSKMIIEPDRAKAIYQAVQMATPEDIVLIAGKGHETYQVCANTRIDFDDRKVAAQAQI